MLFLGYFAQQTSFILYDITLQYLSHPDRCPSHRHCERSFLIESCQVIRLLLSSDCTMQSLGLRNPPMMRSTLGQGDVTTRSYGLVSFCCKFSPHLASKSSKSIGLPGPATSTQKTLNSTVQRTQIKKSHVLICQASEASQTVGDSSPAATTAAAYSKLQNGSDIRGVALDSKFTDYTN